MIPNRAVLLEFPSNCVLREICVLSLWHNNNSNVSRIVVCPPSGDR